jgi:hypothetical protein
MNIPRDCFAITTSRRRCACHKPGGRYVCQRCRSATHAHAVPLCCTAHAPSLFITTAVCLPSTAIIRRHAVGLIYRASLPDNHHYSPADAPHDIPCPRRERR